MEDSGSLVEALEDAGSLVEAMEEWLASHEFDQAWRGCYAQACRGSGRSDRNISENVLYATAEAVHEHLPDCLSACIPEPDKEFVLGALEQISAEDIRRAGVKDLDHFEAALVVVYTQLAICADLFRKQMPGIAEMVEAGYSVA
ncbi:unnamed protein product [Prorocentrum cordatum]|uniref:Uncharacterized protein n=1 Tax=Prorocentrum cordatum TaxID=2364126 RepID=A0ABN9X3R8_9DINO|nr:unnamed protein product [Polarella glacialis]